MKMMYLAPGVVSAMSALVAARIEYIAGDSYFLPVFIASLGLGHIVSSEMQRGLDILELTPSAAITQNELDAAMTVKLDFLNAQDQPKYIWPASFALSKAYTDQLERWNGLTAAQVTAVRSAITAAEGKTGAARKTALASLAAKVRGYAAASSDKARVQWLAASLTDLSNAK